MKVKGGSNAVLLIQGIGIGSLFKLMHYLVDEIILKIQFVTNFLVYSKDNK